MEFRIFKSIVFYDESLKLLISSGTYGFQIVDSYWLRSTKTIFLGSFGSSSYYSHRSQATTPQGLEMGAKLGFKSKSWIFRCFCKKNNNKLGYFSIFLTRK